MVCTEEKESSSQASPNVTKKSVCTAIVMFGIKADTVRVRTTALFRRAATAATTTTSIAADGWCSALCSPVETTTIRIGNVRIVQLVLPVFVQRGKFTGKVRITLAHGEFAASRIVIAQPHKRIIRSILVNAGSFDTEHIVKEFDFLWAAVVN